MHNLLVRIKKSLAWFWKSISSFQKVKFSHIAFVFLVVMGVGFCFALPTRVRAVECSGTDAAGANTPAGCTVTPAAAPPAGGPAAGTPAPSTASTAPEAPGGNSLSDKILMAVASFAVSIAVVLSKLVVTILEMLIPIMTYNNFSNNPVVDSGWAILRDTVNMFFVVVLIAIAFGTIFGVEKFKWQQQMTNLMKFAILINFSRTLCGLMIDFGQVVMLTFANAIREIAAGNFVKMLGMGELYSMSPNNPAIQAASQDPSAPAIQPFDFFASAIASVVMMFVVLCVMIMLMVLLLYRIVMLWILITISPLAWFMGGAQGLIKSSAYTQWWDQFKCLVVIGPILTFFLWLTLIVGGSGDLASSAGFDTSGGLTAATAGGFLTTIFQLPNLISFVVALGLLWAGFDAASSACTAMPGIGNPGAFVKGGVTSMANTAKGLSAKVGGSVIRGAGGAAKKGAGKLADRFGLDDKVLGMKEKYHQTMAKSPLATEDSRIAHKKAAAGAGVDRVAKMKKAGEKYNGLTDDDKDEELARLAKKPPTTPEGKRAAMALYNDARGDQKRMDKLRKMGIAQQLEGEYGADLKKMAKGDKSLKASVDAGNKLNADLTGSMEDIKTPADALRMTPHALATDAAKKQLGSIDSKFDKPGGGGKMTVAEAMAAGKMGTKEQQEAFTKGSSAIFNGMKGSELSEIGPAGIVAGLGASGAGISAELLGKQMGDGKTTFAESMLQSKDPNVQAFVQAQIKNTSPDKDNQASRDALLGSMGIGKDGKIDAGKLNGALGSNIALLPDIMSTIKPEDHGQLTDALQSPGVFKSALSAVRRGGEGSDEMKRALEGMFAATKGNPDMAKMESDYNAQMASMATRAQRVGALKTIGGNIGSVTKDFVGKDLDATIERAKARGQKVVDGVQWVGETKVGQVTKDIAGGAVDAAKSTVDSAKDLTADVADAVSSGVRTRVQKVSSAIDSALQSAAEATTRQAIVTEAKRAASAPTPPPAPAAAPTPPPAPTAPDVVTKAEDDFFKRDVS